MGYQCQSILGYLLRYGRVYWDISSDMVYYDHMYFWLALSVLLETFCCLLNNALLYNPFETLATIQSIIPPILFSYPRQLAHHNIIFNIFVPLNLIWKMRRWLVWDTNVIYLSISDAEGGKQSSCRYKFLQNLNIWFAFCLFLSLCSFCKHNF
jgi:hypothetical protein